MPKDNKLTKTSTRKDKQQSKINAELFKTGQKEKTNQLSSPHKLSSNVIDNSTPNRNQFHSNYDNLHLPVTPTQNEDNDFNDISFMDQYFDDDKSDNATDDATPLTGSKGASGSPKRHRSPSMSTDSTEKPPSSKSKQNNVDNNMEIDNDLDNTIEQEDKTIDTDSMEDTEQQTDKTKTRKNKVSDNNTTEKVTNINKTFDTTTQYQYKTINNQSINRRTCSRLNQTLIRPTNTPLIQHIHKTRGTFRMKLEAKDIKPVDNARNNLVALLQQLQQHDSTVALYPWSEKSLLPCIHKAEEIPNNIADIRNYATKLWLGKANTATTAYPRIRIGHDIPPDELRRDAQPWLDEFGHGLFWSMLQSENPKVIGWFLYSTQKMDAGALRDEIYDIVGVEVGLRWSIIDSGRSTKISNDQKIQALNVEVDQVDFRSKMASLLQFYGKSMKDYLLLPNCLRLRFVKHKSLATNTSDHHKFERLRQRQGRFLNKIQTLETLDITQLDYSPGLGHPTLRQMIMSLTSSENPNIPLFHSVDLDFKQEYFTFQFSPSVQEEAECVVNTLIPLLSYKFPDEAENLETYFTQEAIESSEGYVYDPATNRIIDTLVENQDGTEIVDGDNLLGFNFDEADIPTNPTDDQPLQPAIRPTPSTTIQDRDFPQDTDTVSTLGKGHVRIGAGATINLSHHQTGYTNNSLLDNQSTATSITDSTAVPLEQYKSLEQKFALLEKKNEEQSATLKELLELLKEQKLSTPGSDGPPTGASKAGDSNSGVSGGGL